MIINILVQQRKNVTSLNLNVVQVFRGDLDDQTYANLDSSDNDSSLVSQWCDGDGFVSEVGCWLVTLLFNSACNFAATNNMICRHHSEHIGTLQIRAPKQLSIINYTSFIECSHCIIYNIQLPLNLCHWHVVCIISPTRHKWRPHFQTFINHHYFLWNELLFLWSEL